MEKMQIGTKKSSKVFVTCLESNT